MHIVAPHAGAWIETLPNIFFFQINNVAPHAGAWIETYESFSNCRIGTVAPHAGAWIETVPCSTTTQRTKGRAPRGRVD